MNEEDPKRILPAGNLAVAGCHLVDEQTTPLDSVPASGSA